LAKKEKVSWVNKGGGPSQKKNFGIVPLSVEGNLAQGGGGDKLREEDQEKLNLKKRKRKNAKKEAWGPPKSAHSKWEKE